MKSIAFLFLSSIAFVSSANDSEKADKLSEGPLLKAEIAMALNEQLSQIGKIDVKQAAALQLQAQAFNLSKRNFFAKATESVTEIKQAEAE